MSFTISLNGIAGTPVRVDATVMQGQGALIIRGLPEGAAREARVRVRSALEQNGVSLDGHSILVDIPERSPTGASWDLAIAVAILEAMGRVKTSPDTVFFGELSLRGDIRRSRGALPAGLAAAQHGFARMVTAPVNSEAAHCGLRVEGAQHLNDLLSGAALPVLTGAVAGEERLPVDAPDMRDLRGQHAARRALEVAAAGAHSLLFVGAPGSGKTLLARRLSTILPPLTSEEATLSSAIHSVAGLLNDGILRERPFRAPHYTVSTAGLLGGGDPVRPGEVSLAHHGVLFMDDLHEWRALDPLRSALRDGEVTVSRRGVHTTFPAHPLAIGGIYPCPCGFRGDTQRSCTCTQARLQSYATRVARIVATFDVCAHVAPVTITGPAGECSADIRARVVAARSLQTARFRAGQTSSETNRGLSPKDLRSVAKLEPNADSLLTAASERLAVPVCGVLRVARTIADLEGCDGMIRATHVAEAVHLVKGDEKNERR